MDFQTVLSKCPVDGLKCALCNNFLSYFPIYNCDKQNICGRCILPQGKSSSHNNLYETIAQLVKFPCRYQNEGCEEEMCPEVVPQHEKACPYRIIQCPKAACNWEGNQIAILEHCINKHLDSFIENGEFNVDLTSNNNLGKRFLKHDNILFIVDAQMDHPTKFLKCAVYHLEARPDVKEYCFQLSLQNLNRCISIKLLATQFDEMYFTDLCLDSLKSQSDDYPLVVPGKFTLSGVTEDIDLSMSLLRNLNSLTCAHCLEFVIPPIYQCLLKKVTLCRTCQKNHTMYCTTCYDVSNVATSEDLRNAALEEMAKHFYYPCKNGKNGCTVIIKSTEILQHLENCAFQELECPLNEFVKCSRKDVIKNIYLHLKADHGDKVITNNSEVSLKHFRVGDTNSWLIEFRKHWFRLVFFRSTSEHFCWIVQVVGFSKENFYYRIEITSESKNGPRKLISTGPCSRLCKKKMLFAPTANDYCLFLKDQIKQLNVLTFRVDVFKM